VARPTRPDPPPPAQPGGQRAPDSGPGSVAGFGPRLLAFVIDAILADVLALIINGGPHANGRQSLSSYIAFLLIELVFVSYAGQTPGMRMAGLAVARTDRSKRAPLRWVLLRTLLLATIIPALITDSSGRAMHDRAAGTVMFHVR
jgi:uncharacterized RDD family membrane protein YckC